MVKLYACILGLGISAMSSPFAYATFDGSRDLLCAPAQAIECGSAFECNTGSPESVNIPQFINIDFKANKVEAVRHGEPGRQSFIRSQERGEGKLIMQGIEAGRGWNIIISETTGKFSASVAGDQVGFIVFGACTPWR